MEFFGYSLLELHSRATKMWILWLFLFNKTQGSWLYLILKPYCPLNFLQGSSPWFKKNHSHEYHFVLSCMPLCTFHIYSAPWNYVASCRVFWWWVTHMSFSYITCPKTWEIKRKFESTPKVTDLDCDYVSRSLIWVGSCKKVNCGLAFNRFLLFC